MGIITSTVQKSLNSFSSTARGSFEITIPNDKHVTAIGRDWNCFDATLRLAQQIARFEGLPFRSLHLLQNPHQT